MPAPARQPKSPDIAAMLPIVIKLVGARFRNVPDHVAGFDDLVQVGMLGVLQAAKRYRPDAGATFAQYAWRRAFGAIQDHLRSSSFGGRLHYADVSVCSLDAPLSQDAHVSLGDILPTETHFADPYLGLAIDEAIAALPLDVQSAFALRHEEDLEMHEIGEMMGVTESRVSQWIGRAHRAVAEHPTVREHAEAA